MATRKAATETKGSTEKKAPARRRAPAKKAPKSFELDMDSIFGFTGRAKTEWFLTLEPDEKYGKIGGRLYPENMSKVQEVYDDLIAQAQEQCDAAGVKVTVLSPFHEDEENNRTGVTVSRAGTKKDGSEVFFKFRNIRGKPCAEPEEELGNGSTVNVKYFAHAWYMPEKTEAGVKIPARIGVSFKPLEVQIIDHVVYEGDEWDDESGDEEDWDDEEETASEKGSRGGAGTVEDNDDY